MAVAPAGSGPCPGHPSAACVRGGPTGPPRRRPGAAWPQSMAQSLSIFCVWVGCRGWSGRGGSGEGLHKGDGHRGAAPWPGPTTTTRGRPADDHRADLRARPRPGAPHAMVGRLNEPVLASSAASSATCGSRVGGRRRRTSPHPRPSRGRRAHRPGPSGPGGWRPVRRPAPRCGAIPIPSATAHSTRADHPAPPLETCPRETGVSS